MISHEAFVRGIDDLLLVGTGLVFVGRGRMNLPISIHHPVFTVPSVMFMAHCFLQGGLDASRPRMSLSFYLDITLGLLLLCGLIYRLILLGRGTLALK